MIAHQQRRRDFRITVLRGVQVQHELGKSTLKPYPEDIADGLAHVDALSAVLADYARKIRAAIEGADRLGDADTADLFTGISRETDKYLWFLEAHLHAKR